jgi:hypothetical protein
LLFFLQVPRKFDVNGFKKIYNSDGLIHTFKVRLVTQGFRQNERIDYFDTFASVAHITFIRVLLVLPHTNIAATN